MSTHFPTVPVEAACLPLSAPEWLRPLVLIVDDEPLITETLAAILDGNGFAVLTALNAADALEIARLMPPQLLIADVSMPAGSGIELAIEITRGVPDCEVILFSGRAAIFDADLSMSRTGRDFVLLTKPVHPADLLEHAFERLKLRGASVVPGKTPRHLSLHDYLSSVRDSEVGSSTWSVTMRRRSRPGAAAGAV